MLKHAFRSYILSLHPKRRHHVKEKQKSFLISYIYSLILVGVFFHEEILVTISQVLPISLLRWDTMLIGAYMGKGMLLCPMAKEERKQYINYMIGFKIGCPMCFGFLIEMFWSIVYGFDIKRTLFLMLIYVSIGIAETIHIDCMDKIDNRILQGRKDGAGNVKWGMQNFLISMISLFLLIGNCGMNKLLGEQSIFYHILNYAGSAALIVLDIIVLCTQYKDMVEEMTDYELAFHIPGRLHYIKDE